MTVMEGCLRESSPRLPEPCASSWPRAEEVGGGGGGRALTADLAAPAVPPPPSPPPACRARRTD